MWIPIGFMLKEKQSRFYCNDTYDEIVDNASGVG